MFSMSNHVQSLKSRADKIEQEQQELRLLKEQIAELTKQYNEKKARIEAEHKHLASSTLIQVSTHKKLFPRIELTDAENQLKKNLQAFINLLGFTAKFGDLPIYGEFNRLDSSTVTISFENRPELRCVKMLADFLDPENDNNMLRATIPCDKMIAMHNTLESIETRRQQPAHPEFNRRRTF